MKIRNTSGADSMLIDQIWLANEVKEVPEELTEEFLSKGFSAEVVEAVEAVEVAAPVAVEVPVDGEH